MFGMTFLKFPGRKLSAADTLGVSHITSEHVSPHTNRFITRHRHVCGTNRHGDVTAKRRAGSRPTRMKRSSIQQRDLTGAQMRMLGGRGVPAACPLTPEGGAVLSVAESLTCVGSFDDTVRERPVTKCCPHMLHMLRRLGIPGHA